MSNYKYVPANLTVDTFIDRVRAGEVFYTQQGTRVYYNYKKGFDNPFRLGYMSFYDWPLVPELTTRVEPTWKDELSEENPVLCWVSDLAENTRSRASMIKAVNKWGFAICSQGFCWDYATPVLPTECRSIDK